MLDNKYAHAEALNSAKLVGLEEAARFLDVSKRSVQRFVKQGRLPALRLTSRLLKFRPEDISAFAAATSSVFLCPDSKGGRS
jgi:excisionase family DNA binding protein